MVNLTEESARERLASYEAIRAEAEALANYVISMLDQTDNALSRTAVDERVQQFYKDQYIALEAVVGRFKELNSALGRQVKTRIRALQQILSLHESLNSAVRGCTDSAAKLTSFLDSKYAEVVLLLGSKMDSEKLTNLSDANILEALRQLDDAEPQLVATLDGHVSELKRCNESYRQLVREDVDDDSSYCFTGAINSLERKAKAALDEVRSKFNIFKGLLSACAAIYSDIGNASREVRETAADVKQLRDDSDCLPADDVSGLQTLLVRLKQRRDLLDTFREQLEVAMETKLDDLEISEECFFASSTAGKAADDRLFVRHTLEEAREKVTKSLTEVEAQLNKLFYETERRLKSTREAELHVEEAECELRSIEREYRVASGSKSCRLEELSAQIDKLEKLHERIAQLGLRLEKEMIGRDYSAEKLASLKARIAAAESSSAQAADDFRATQRRLENFKQKSALISRIIERIHVECGTEATATSEPLSKDAVEQLVHSKHEGDVELVALKEQSSALVQDETLSERNAIRRELNAILDDWSRLEAEVGQRVANAIADRCKRNESLARSLKDNSPTSAQSLPLFELVDPERLSSQLDQLRVPNLQVSSDELLIHRKNVCLLWF